MGIPDNQSVTTRRRVPSVKNAGLMENQDLRHLIRLRPWKEKCLRSPHAWPARTGVSYLIVLDGDTTSSLTDNILQALARVNIEDEGRSCLHAQALVKAYSDKRA